MGEAMKDILDAAEPFARAWAMLPKWVIDPDELGIVDTEYDDLARIARIGITVAGLRQLALAVEDYHCHAGQDDEKRAVLSA